jgi:hypothetical protein
MEGMILGVIQGLTNLALAVIVPTTTLMMIWGAYQYLSSGSSPKRAEDGKTTAIRAAIGLAVALGAGLIIANVRSWTGL